MQHEIYVELCEEAKKTVEDNNMCAKLRMSMYGTKAAAQNWHKKVQETMATHGFRIGKASPVLFCHHQRSLTCHVRADDFVVSGEPVDLVWMRNELGSKLEINTATLGDEPAMFKEVKILNRKLCWHDGVGISYEADQKHAEAIIRETGASNLTSLKITMSKESKEDVRDKTDDIVEKRMFGKLGMKEQPLIGHILSPAETTRKRAWAATANFLAIDKGDIVYCAKELTRHMATPTTTDWEKVVRLGSYLKKTHPEFDCGTNFKKRRVNLKRTQTQIDQGEGSNAGGRGDGGGRGAGANLSLEMRETHEVAGQYFAPRFRNVFLCRRRREVSVSTRRTFTVRNLRTLLP